MKIEEFIEKQKELLEQYRQDYKNDHEKSPEEFPEEMDGIGEWVSDFSCWLELKELE
ncbi:hypothetical protein [Salmonella phage SSE121]|uniref:Uncharacterized protein n=4 Tax=Seunavirus TaxID=1914851 RepID=K4I5N4_9CAUD|nr:hypothetical protein ACQ19_gp159 [Salmonella phage SSE121]AFU63800.1 hypothetical protein [Salmonella phage SSE121]QXL90540.1 hypothetical protein [Salmonella phage NINP13076]